MLPIIVWIVWFVLRCLMAMVDDEYGYKYGTVWYALKSLWVLGWIFITAWVLCSFNCSPIYAVTG
jgi:hypothetical protein